MTCISGPPWLAGKTCLSTAFAYASEERIIPPRGPRRVLCVVVVTMSATFTGEGCAPPATSPAKWAMSTIKTAPTSFAMAAKAAKSMIRGYALPPATITFGFSACARSRT